MALDPASMVTSHSSNWVVIALVGNFSGGDVGVVDLDRVWSLGTQSILTLSTQYRVQGFSYVGERYQLEFFMPN